MSINFTELFREEREIWVKTLIPGQVSIGFDLGMGRSDYVTVPHTGDPVRITDRIPFDAVKRSTDLRILSNPRRAASGGYKPAAIAILTAEEADEHFARKAVRRQMFVRDAKGNVVTGADGNPLPDIEAAKMPRMTEGAEGPAPARVAPPKPEETDETREIKNLGSKNVVLADPVHPRVQVLCYELTTAAQDNQRMLADDVVDELESLEDLNVETLKHIVVNGYYKTVKKWAEQRLAEHPDSVSADE